MFEKRFPEKRAFVTGAASGLGLEICRSLAKDNWRLMIADINADSLADVERELIALGAKILPLVLNVADHKQIDDAAERLQQEWGGVDIVFNNAGVAGAGEFENMSLTDWQRLIDIDLWSVIHGCRAFIPMMKTQGNGYIVNTASSAGTLSAPQMANYNVAKAGVISLSETLKVELASYGIGVSVICPTLFVSKLVSSSGIDNSFGKNLSELMAKSKVTSAQIVDITFNAMLKNRLYVMPQPDALWGWRLKRFMPELYFKFLTYMYKRRKWLFSHLD